MARNGMKKSIVWFAAAGISAAVAVVSTSALSLTAEDGKPVTPNSPLAKPGNPNSTPQAPIISREGSMTIEKMRAIVKRLDANAREVKPGSFAFIISDFQVSIVSAIQVNRMRVMVRIRSSEELSREELYRISQANLDSALDARYAIGQGALWATFIHPFSSLHPKQFIEAIGSTVNLARNYGTTYSSGQLFFGGGDSGGIIGRQLIDELIKKGEEI